MIVNLIIYSYKFLFLLFYITDTKCQCSSLSEDKCRKLISNEGAQKILSFTTNFLTKVNKNFKNFSRYKFQLLYKFKYSLKIYPAGIRQDSSNVNPVTFWNYGFQIGMSIKFLFKIE